MLRFIKHHVDTIEGVEIYPIISLVIFFVFFTAMIWFISRTPSEIIADKEMLPFDDSLENDKNLN